MPSLWILPRGSKSSCHNGTHMELLMSRLCKTKPWKPTSYAPGEWKNKLCFIYITGYYASAITAYVYTWITSIRINMDKIQNHNMEWGKQAYECETIYCIRRTTKQKYFFSRWLTHTWMTFYIYILFSLKGETWGQTGQSLLILA